MKQRCLVKAPAKINLHLQVGGVRDDGFHDIKSLNIMISLYDEIIISSLKTGNQCEIQGSFDCVTEQNLIYKAWRFFNEAAGTDFGTCFRVKKNIPVFAGLGGGSSDAAAVLKGMNELYQTGFSLKQLSEISEKIGSDVPFFLYAPAAIVEGRGEIVKNVENPEILNIVVVKPDFPVSTGSAYKLVDEYGLKSNFLDDKEILSIYHSRGLSKEDFSNDFDIVLSKKIDTFNLIKNCLYQSGAYFSSITGSGSVVFGLYREEKNAEKAAEQLKKQYNFVQKIKSLDRIPYAILE